MDKEKQEEVVSFEENISKLELIIKKLESGECSLDDAIDNFTEGMKLVKSCSDKLSNAREKVNKILGENGELVDFEAPEE